MKLIVAIVLALSTLGAFAAPSRPIPGQYIVMFRNSVADPVAVSDRIVREAGGRRHHAYTRVLKGFAATLSDAAVERLRNDPDVVAIEQDQEVTIDDVEDQAPWGLDRIDQADRPLDTQYHYNATGAGVYAFIIDTGIRADHVEFGHRVIAGYTAVADGNGTNDCHGHGTHVAGTVGGATYGVAKQVTLVPVRVLGCSGSGSYSGIIAGIDWAVNSNLRPAVANMSLGGARSSIVNSAVARATAAGITMVVAAGNDNSDACTKSPASEPSAITVGATTDTSDTRAVFSNFGTCVDLFAPGVNITSSWNSSPTATNTISGTSMATPHVTGIAALVAAANPSSSPAAISAFIVANASANKIASVGTGSPNLLAYSLGTGTPVEPPPREVAVSSLTGQPQRSGHNWRARISVSVRDLSTGRSASGATVQGTFSTGRSGQCTTNNRGTCNIVSLSTPATTAAIVFTVSDIELTGFAYAADQNAATQVTVTQNRR